MRVLVITRNAWDDTNSIGNTMSNFFKDQEDLEIANIYFRSSMPYNTVCTRFFHVTERDIIRHWFDPEKCGQEFEYHPVKKKSSSYSGENKMISLIHRFSLKPAYLLSDYLWNSKKWINEKLSSFVDDFRPDIVFSFAKSSPQYYHLLRYLKEKHHLKSALWIGDDEYTALSASRKKQDRESIRRLKYILEQADRVWGCSQEICDYYHKVFGCEATPLYKNCDFRYPVRTEVGQPLKMVYAGNLLFGRYDILIRVIRQLKELNQNGTKAQLDIYSSTPLSENELSRLNVSGTSELHGVIPYDEICRKMAESDIVLLVESFEEDEIIKTRYSFSTKIIDCLQSGSVTLAVGPPQIASIRYIKKIPGAYVIDSIDAVREGIAEIIDSSRELPHRAEQIRRFAVENHSQRESRLQTI